MFYIGLAAGPMSVVAPVSGLVSTVLPVAVALAEGERPGSGVYAGALLCLVAIVMTSSAGGGGRGAGAGRTGRAGAGDRRTAWCRGPRSGCSSCSSATPAQSGEFWPVAAGRVGELATVLIAAAVLRRGLLAAAARTDGCWWRRPGRASVDVVANICYVAAARTGAFGLAVVLASLYPGFTVLLARVVLGERLRWGAAGRPRARRDRHPAGHDVSAARPGAGTRRAALRLVPTTDQFGAEFHVPRGF